MPDPVRRMRRHRKIAALHLVKALRPGLYGLQAAFNGKLDGLIVAGFEMQTGNVEIAPPVAPEQTVLADEVQKGVR